MNSMKVIGLDIGTTGICGVVLDAKTGQTVCTQTVPSEAFIPTSSAWEKIQDVDKILAIVRTILGTFCKTYAGDIAAIGLTGQMHGIVYIDGEGNACSPLYTWQDGRGNRPYRDTTYAEYLGSYSGYGNVTDFYNRRNGLVPPEAVSYCTIHDYVGMVLCGRKTPLVHVSDAASFGLYDTEKRAFSSYPCPVAVTEDFELLGTYGGIPVSVAIGDNQAGVFATLADENAVLLNVGTGSQVSLVIDQPMQANGIECRPYVGGKYLLVGAALCGGRAYSLLKDFYAQLLQAANVRDIDMYAYMNSLLRDKTTTSLHVDTRFAGTRTDPAVRGSITGISTENFTPADLTRGVLHGMMEELHGMYVQMGAPRVGLVGSGNGIRKNPALVRVAEEVFGAPLRVPIYIEEAACGAALFALVAAGICKTPAEAQACIRYEDEP